MYINPEWLLQDEHARQLKIADRYVDYSDAVDREIQEVCIDAGVRISEIPTDEAGFVTSLHLRNFGVAFAVYSLFAGHWGIRDSTADIYRDKADRYRQEYLEKRRKMKRMHILGDEACMTDPVKRSRVSSIPMV